MDENEARSAVEAIEEHTDRHDRLCTQLATSRGGGPALTAAAIAFDEAFYAARDDLLRALIVAQGKPVPTVRNFA